MIPMKEFIKEGSTMTKMNWNAPYIDRRTWILDHLESLHVEGNEVLVLLLIDYFNQTRKSISHEVFSDKLKIDVDAVEDLFTSLSDKGYLSIEFKNGQIHFNIEGIFSQNESGVPLEHSLIEQFESAFKRTLSSAEMQRILNMSATYDERRVVCALNEAVVYEKLSLDYIERILQTWMQKGLSIEDVENGKR